MPNDYIPKGAISHNAKIAPIMNAPQKYYQKSEMSRRLFPRRYNLEGARMDVNRSDFLRSDGESSELQRR